MNEDQNSLLKLVASRPWETYAGARVGFIACRVGETLVNLMGSIVLTLDLDVPDSGTVEVGPFLLHVGYYDAETTERVLRRLAEPDPILALPDHEIALRGAGGPPSWGRGGVGEVPLDGFRWRSDVITWSGTSTSELMDNGEYHRTSNRLPGADPLQFADWSRVTKWAVPTRGQAGTFGPNWASLLDIHAPTFVRLHSAACDPTTGTLDAHVDARHKAEELSAVLWDQAGQQVGRLEASEFAIRQDCSHYCASISLDSDIGPVHLDLLLDGDRLERRLVGVPPSSVRLYRSLDPDLTWIARLEKKAAQKKSDSFEQWVHALLSLAGVTTIHFGHGQGEFPDLTGWIFPNVAVAAEVTLRAPDLNKLVELQSRVLSMREALSRSVPAGAVFPVMFFNQSGPEVPGEIWAAAEQQGIALVTEERSKWFRDAVLSGVVTGFGVIETLREWGGRA